MSGTVVQLWPRIILTCQFEGVKLNLQQPPWIIQTNIVVDRGFSFTVLYKVVLLFSKCQ